MSWSVEGRTYHSLVEYQQALARQQATRLRRMVERLEIPRADTHRIEQEVAAAQAHQHAVQRLSAQVRHQAAERQDDLASQRQELRHAFAEIERSEAHLLRDLEGLQRRLAEGVGRLEDQRREAKAATAAALEEELLVDRRDASRAGARREALVGAASRALEPWSAPRLRSLGLDRAGIESLLARARSADATEGLELARRAHDQAQALDMEATYREAKIKSLVEVYRAEVQELRSSLDFSPGERENLVGTGASALDLPMQRELDRLLERIESVTSYEDHEDRFARIGQALDSVSLRISDLVAQIRDFDKLEEARVDLVRNRLQENLSEALREPVHIVEVEPGTLGLQPVEVRLRTAGGEKIDCSIAIDGTLRIHHYEHIDQASCARSARQLTASLPELMTLTGEPKLDLAARVSGDSPAARTNTHPGLGAPQKKPTE